MSELVSEQLKDSRILTLSGFQKFVVNMMPVDNENEQVSKWLSSRRKKTFATSLYMLLSERQFGGGMGLFKPTIFCDLQKIVRVVLCSKTVRFF